MDRRLTRLQQFLLAAAIVAAVAWTAVCPADRGRHIGANQSELIRGLLPTVVNISVRKDDPPAPTPPAADASAATPADPGANIKNYVGSGFIIDPSDLIRRNHHVVEYAFEITVMFPTAPVCGPKCKARRALQTSPIVRWTPVTRCRCAWGNSDKLQVGDQVFAAGDPFGIGLSVSAGIVSGSTATSRIYRMTISSRPTPRSITAIPAVRCSTCRATWWGSTRQSSRSTDRFGRSWICHPGEQRPLRRRSVADLWLGASRLDRRKGADGHPARWPRRWACPSPRDPSSPGCWRTARRTSRTGNRRRHPDLRRQQTSDDRALLRAIAHTPVGDKVPVVVRRRGRNAPSATIEEWPRNQWDARDAPVAVLRPRDLSILADLGLGLAAFFPWKDKSKLASHIDLGWRAGNAVSPRIPIGAEGHQDWRRHPARPGQPGRLAGRRSGWDRGGPLRQARLRARSVLPQKSDVPGAQMDRSQLGAAGG